MKYIAISSDEAYIIKAKKLEEIIDLWHNLCEERNRFNFNLYTKIYREKLGIPVDVSIEEEGNLIHEKYGNMPVANHDFVNALGKFRTAYNKHWLAPVDFREWAEERGCKLEEVTVIEF